MAFKVVQHKTDDVYEIMCKLWDLHKFPRINRIVLPENTFICYIDDKPIYTTCFYFTDAKGLAWLGWQISNPKIPFTKREGGLKFLTNYICNYAKKKKIKTLITTSSDENVLESLKVCGFEVGDTNVNHMVKSLK